MRVDNNDGSSPRVVADPNVSLGCPIVVADPNVSLAFDLVCVVLVDADDEAEAQFNRCNSVSISFMAFTFSLSFICLYFGNFGPPRAAYDRIVLVTNPSNFCLYSVSRGPITLEMVLLHAFLLGRSCNARLPLDELIMSVAELSRAKEPLPLSEAFRAMLANRADVV